MSMVPAPFTLLKKGKELFSSPGYSGVCSGGGERLANVFLQSTSLRHLYF